MNEGTRKALELAKAALDVLYINDYGGYECSKHFADKISEAESAIDAALSAPATPVAQGEPIPEGELKSILTQTGYDRASPAFTAVFRDGVRNGWVAAHRITKTGAPAAPVAHPVIGPEWQACVKLPITVHVREQRPGEARVSTREGITPVRPDDLIMRGVAGEEYPIGRELFDRTYRLGDAPAAPVVQPRMPMSFDDAGEIAKSAESAMFRNLNLSWRMALIRATEAFHGITKEGGAA